MDAIIRIKQLRFYLQQEVEICNELTRGKVYKVTMMPYH